MLSALLAATLVPCVFRMHLSSSLISSSPYLPYTSHILLRVSPSSVMFHLLCPCSSHMFTPHLSFSKYLNILIPFTPFFANASAFSVYFPLQLPSIFLSINAPLHFFQVYLNVDNSGSDLDLVEFDVSADNKCSDGTTGNDCR